MLTKKNVVMLEGGLTKAPDVFEDAGVVHLSVAIDSAGSEKGTPNATGYFDVKVWLKPSKYSAAIVAENVKAALDNGTLAKGSRVSIVGRLVQERWEKDGKRSSKTVVVAESLDCWASSSQRNQQAQTGEVEQAKPQSQAAGADFENF